jgi:zinc/manganese transport system permease protein
MAVAPVLAAVGYQANWVEVVSAGFMRAAFAGGALVAVSAGLLGYFVVVRRNAFAAHAIAHIGFPGATGAALIGAPVTAGLAVFCVAGALAMGAVGRRRAERETATGIVLAFATGLGLLFSSLSSRNVAGVTSVLFGNLLAITGGQLVTFAAFTAVLVGVMALVARPLTFASVAPEVAEARGVPVRVLDVAFLVLLGLVVTMAVQVVGTLLLFGLVVTPAATALTLTARPLRVAAVSTALGLACVVSGLLLAAMFNLPPSFVAVSLSTAAWVLTSVATRSRRRAGVTDGSAAGVVGGHQHARVA